MIGRGEVEPHHPEERVQKPLGLPTGQVEEETQRQCVSMATSEYCRCPPRVPTPAGAQVALIEDVSTTGHQVLRAAKTLEAEGCQVGIIILAIDRGGAEHLREAGYWVKAVVEVRPQD